MIKENEHEKIKRRQSGSENLSVVGSGRLAQTLMEHNLVDEYVLWVHPVVLGSGKRLFRDGGPKIALRLVDTQTTGSGVVILTYQPATK